MTTTTGIKKENGRLRITTGITNSKLKITPDMEVGRLYHYENNIDELAALGQVIGLSPAWIQNRLTGLAHFDLWGTPLKSAKKMFKIVTREEAWQDYGRLEQEHKDYFEDAKREVDLESKEQDLIRTNLGYVSFVSKSKGRGRRRRNWKEVELFRFAGGDMRMGLHYRWHTANKARFDEMTEIMNKEMADSPISGDDLMWYAKAHCDRNGGKQHGIH